MMTAVVIVLMIIWLCILQRNLSDLSDSIKELKSALLKSNADEQEGTPELSEKLPQSDEPLSISDIPDDVVFNKKIDKIQQAAESVIKPETCKKSFENLFLGNIFNKIGALAILVGLIILIKIVSPFIVFTPQLKIILGYLAGLGLIAGGLKLHSKENMQNYAEVLLGTGFGAMFISTYCASALFKFFNFTHTIIIATLLLLAAFYLADKLKTISMLVISLVASYLTPIFLNSEFDVPSNFLFGYLIFINILSLAYTCRNKSREIVNTVNLCITLAAALILCYDINLVLPLILWALYLIYDLFISADKSDNKALNYINLAVLTCLLLKTFTHDFRIIGYTELAVAFVYSIITYLKKSAPETFKNYLNLSLAAAFLMVFFICDESPTTKCYVWAVESVVLAYYAYRYKMQNIAKWTVLIWAAAAFSIIPVDGVFAIKSIKNFTPVWNVRLLMFMPVILSSAASYYLLSKSDDKKFINLAESFKFACITSIYFYMGLELNNIITQRFVGENTSAHFINNMTNAILGFAYTISLKRLNTIDSDLKPFVSILAAIAGIFSALFLIFTGVHYSPIKAFIPVINIRAAAFLLGIAACIVYNKFSEKDFYKYLAMIFGFILVHYEIVDVISKYSITDGEYLISVAWILYSGIITTIGILKNKSWLKICGIGFCILSIIRIFIYDLANIDILYKFIAIITLGIILMILSYLYNKKSSK